MTESEWLTCRNPWAMLSELGEQASDRKLRLVICACCHRRIDGWGWDCPLPLRSALQAAEQLSDRRETPSGFQTVEELVQDGLATVDDPTGIVAWIGQAIAYTVNVEPLQPGHAAIAADVLVQSVIEFYSHLDPDDERSVQCDLIRDIFRNPFRPSVRNPAWLTGTVVSLAQAIYDTGEFTRLPILADALEDAGCTDDAILRHCREPGQHVKGCWVVDLLIGKK